MGCSFRFGREIALLSHANGYIADDELMLLLDENMSSNPEFSYEIYGRFDLNEIPEAECKSDFRFEKKDIPLLANVLGIPETFKCPQRSVVPGIEGLCALLKRMAYPCRYSDMISIFGRPVPVLSMVTNQVLDYIYETHGHRITQWNHNILNPVLLQRYTESIWQKGAALENCLGFVDGTVRPICRPNKHQRIVYNGHKRVHSLKFQSIAIPNGLIANMYGPVEGKRHDAGMLRDSSILVDLERHAFTPAGHPLCIYGDPAYPLRIHLQAPFRDAVLTDDMAAFNASMSSVRVSVEWLFGDIVRSFKFLDFKNNLKIGLSAIGKMYVVCALIRNALTCLYGNQTSDYFGIDPPTIQQYFS